MRPFLSVLGIATLACGGRVGGAPPRVGASASPPRIEIPSGLPPIVDGDLSPNEWSDAGSVGIQVARGCTVTVFFKHTDSDLYFAFKPLSAWMESYAEVVVDARNDRSCHWDSDDWWFHASYNDCEARGRFNVWNCGPSKPGWTANNYPLRGSGTIEFQISYAKLGLTGAVHQIGLCLAVSTGDEWLPWPEDAHENRPCTWGEAILAK